MKQLLKKKSNKVIAGLLCAVLLLTSLTMLLTGTFAVGTVEKAFSQQNPLETIEVGATKVITAYNAYAWSSSDNGTATVTAITGDRTTATAKGIKAGVAVFTAGTKTGIISTSRYQIVNSNNITAYTMTNSGEITFKKSEISATKDVYSILTPTPNTTAVKNPSTANGGGIKWASTNADVAIVTEDGNVTAMGEGVAALVGTVTDMWGAQQYIPIAVQVGSISDSTGALVDDGKGSCWYPTDEPNIWIESDEDGSIKIPPNYIFDKDETGPADATNPSIPVGRGDDGKYYEQDPSFPSIWHEIDPATGEKTGNSIWGGTDGVPGGGDDRPAYKDSATGNWWADLGQNIFDRVNPNGTLANDLTGGGTTGKPFPNGVKPIYYNPYDGRYYVGPLGPDDDGNMYYYGDSITNGDGLVNSTATGKHATDDVFYYDPETGMMTKKAPATAAPQITQITVISNPDKRVYKVGETFEPNGLILEVTYQDGTTEQVVSGYTYAPTGAFTSTGTNVPVTITYGGKTTSVHVTVRTVAAPTDTISTEVTGRVLSAVKAGDTSSWIEIAQNGGYSLILRSYCEKPNAWFNKNEKNSRYDVSELRSRMNAFYSKLPEESGLKQYAVTSNALTRIVVGTTVSLDAFSVPSVNSPTSTSTDVAFALSYQEVVRYSSNISSATSISKANYKLLKTNGDADKVEYMTRTPYGSGCQQFWHVTSAYRSGDGGFHHDYTDYSFPEALGYWCEASYGKGWGVRPAMWVNSEIFD